MKYILILAGVLTSAAAQVMLKKASHYTTKEPRFFLFFCLGGFFYVGAFGLYTYLLKLFTLSKLSPVMTVLTMALTVGSGVLFFKEAISWTQGAGIALGIASILLILH